MTKKMNSNYINKYLHDPSLNDIQKMEAIKIKAEMLEQRARMDERLLRVEAGNGRMEVEKTMAVNDMYIEAITAKLKILD